MFNGRNIHCPYHLQLSPSDNVRMGSLYDAAILADQSRSVIHVGVSFVVVRARGYVDNDKSVNLVKIN